MALPKLFQRIFWHNNTTPAIQEDNLNAMSKGLSDIDDRVISLAGTIMEDVPQIQEDMEELEADMAVIDTKIASATAEANRATTAANNAAASVISAGNKALVAEGWAKGTQNGTAVGSSSPYYHNNAEYFKNQARSFTPEGYQDLVDDVDSLKETLTNFEESITGDVVDSEPYVLRQGLGNLADMNLVGGSLAWNQLIQNGNFVNSDYWQNHNTTSSVSNNIMSVTSMTTGDNYTEQRYSSPIGHKILFIGSAKAPQANARVFTNYYGDSSNYSAHNAPNTDWNTYSAVKICSNTAELTIRLTNRLADATIQFKNVMLIDLTALFGSSTIADYIYALEQATAGAGVAWFRKYFPNVYYGYQSGKIESVNVASRKVVRKNLFNPNTFVRGLLDVNTSEVVNDNKWITSDFTYVGESGKVVLSGWKRGSEPNFCVRFMAYDAQKKRIDSITNINTSDAQSYTRVLTLPSNTRYVRATFGFNNKILTVSEFFATNDIQLEIGTEATAYEPYQFSTYAFDSSKELRGIPKLVDNKLSYDGDIYTADGTVIRKYGIVDLGSLSYTVASVGNGTLFYTGANPTSNIKNTVLITDIANAVCILTIKSQSDVDAGNAEGLSIGPDSSRIRIFSETTYKNMTAEQFKTAMSGVYLVYELATPTTETASPYQNPQRAFTDGTEEFVDYGVQSATRDVSIPVGNNTTYQLNETLPPTEDYVDGALKFKAAISALGTDESGRTTASRAYTTGEFFYKDGRMYKVLTSIAQGATFTINTNCQQTTLFAELKALAQ